MTVAVRYGAMRRQFGPAGGPEISVLDYRSQQEKLMPLLASAYGIHFTTRFLVTQYAEAKRTKEEDVIADVHALSAGEPLLCTHRRVVMGGVPKEAAVPLAGPWRERCWACMWLHEAGDIMQHLAPYVCLHSASLHIYWAVKPT